MAIVFDQDLKDLRAARHPEKAHRPDSAVQRKPDWIRVKAPVSREYAETKAIVREHGLHTVCEEAGCPNIGECWTNKHATMMIMGDTCTRACAFCNVKTGLPGPLDLDEPANVGRAVAKLGLKHVVITSVDRDDLGHVVLVLAEFGGVLDQLFVFLVFGLLQRHRGLVLVLLFDRFALFAFEIGVFDLIGADRRQLLLDRRRRPRPARP